MGWAEGKEELRGLVRHRKQTCKRDECCLPERWWGGGCHMWPEKRAGGSSTSQRFTAWNNFKIKAPLASCEG